MFLLLFISLPFFLVRIKASLIGCQNLSCPRFGKKKLLKLRQKYLPQIWHANCEVLTNFGTKPNSYPNLGLPKFWQPNFGYYQ
jgi:hypothetical protein